MVVAIVALLVALGGTSIAAVTALPTNSVGTLQLKGNAVVSSKVKNHSLLKADFANGQLPKGPQGPQGPLGPQGPQGPAGPAGAASPGYVAQVVSQTSNASSSTNSTSFVDVPNTSQTITVPTGQTAKFYVFFTAETACYGGVGAQFCNVRATVDGTELQPTTSSFAFASTEVGTATSNYRASYGLIRVSDTLAAGNHTVKLQYKTTSGPVTFRLDNWALVIEQTKVT